MRVRVKLDVLLAYVHFELFFERRCRRCFDDSNDLWLWT